MTGTRAVRAPANNRASAARHRAASEASTGMVPISGSRCPRCTSTARIAVRRGSAPLSRCPRQASALSEGVRTVTSAMEKRGPRRLIFLSPLNVAECHRRAALFSALLLLRLEQLPREIGNFSHLATAIGGQMTWYGVPAALKSIYGEHPLGLTVFMRIRAR